MFCELCALSQNVALPLPKTYVPFTLVQGRSKRSLTDYIEMRDPVLHLLVPIARFTDQLRDQRTRSDLDTWRGRISPRGARSLE